MHFRAKSDKKNEESNEEGKTAMIQETLPICDFCDLSYRILSIVVGSAAQIRFGGKAQVSYARGEGFCGQRLGREIMTRQLLLILWTPQGHHPKEQQQNQSVRLQ